MPSNSFGFATDANKTGIAEFRVPAGKPAPIPSIHITTSHLTNLLPCIFTSLEATFPHVVLKWLPWRSKIELGSWLLAQSPHFLTCKQSGRAKLVPTSLGTSQRAKLLQGSSLSRKNGTVWTSRECVLIVIAVLEPHLLLTKMTSFKVVFPFPRITLVLQPA